MINKYDLEIDMIAKLDELLDKQAVCLKTCFKEWKQLEIHTGDISEGMFGSWAT